MLLFPDTNFLLQFRHPAEIPWSEITADPEVRLLISRTVQNEVDRFKGDGNARRAEQARKVSRQFATIIKEGTPLVLREKGPRVILDLAPRVPPGYSHPNTLDLTRNDDRIVAEVLAYASLSGEAVCLLTDDTGMMVTARAEGLSFTSTPESWRLPPQTDSRDKRIAELEREIKRFVRAGPILEVKADSNSVLIRRVRYKPLPREVVGQLLSTLRENCPLETDFPRETDSLIVTEKFAEAAQHARTGDPGATFYNLQRSIDQSLGSLEWEAPTDKEISEYQEAYAAWLDDVRSHLENVHTELPGADAPASFSWSLVNTGTVPAEGLIIEIEAVGGVVLVTPSEELEERPRTNPNPKELPTAPVAPRWKRVPKRGSWRHSMRSMMAGLEGLSSRPQVALDPNSVLSRIMLSSQPSKRDPLCFYWRGKPNQETSGCWTFECSEFRHRTEPETFEVSVLAPWSASIERGAVRFRASARNLPDPLEDVVEVRVETKEGDTETAARALVEKAVKQSARSSEPWDAMDPQRE